MGHAPRVEEFVAAGAQAQEAREAREAHEPPLPPQGPGAAESMLLVVLAMLSCFVSFAGRFRLRSLNRVPEWFNVNGRASVAC